MTRGWSGTSMSTRPARPRRTSRASGTGSVLGQCSRSTLMSGLNRKSGFIAGPALAPSLPEIVAESVAKQVQAENDRRHRYAGHDGEPGLNAQIALRLLEH